MALQKAQEQLQQVRFLYSACSSSLWTNGAFTTHHVNVALTSIQSEGAICMTLARLLTNLLTAGCTCIHCPAHTLPWW